MATFRERIQGSPVSRGRAMDERSLEREAIQGRNIPDRLMDKVRDLDFKGGPTQQPGGPGGTVKPSASVTSSQAPSRPPSLPDIPDKPIRDDNGRSERDNKLPTPETPPTPPLMGGAVEDSIPTIGPGLGAQLPGTPSVPSTPLPPWQDALGDQGNMGPTQGSQGSQGGTAAVEQTSDYQNTRNQLLLNAIAPSIPEAARQEFVPMHAQGGEFLSTQGTQIDAVEQATTTKVVSQGYESALAAEAIATTPEEVAAAKATAAQAAQAVKGQVNKLVVATTADPQKAEAAIQALDQVDPRTLASAVTRTMPNGATVKGQLDSLLGDLEQGEIPVWARPAVAAAESAMSARGISSSSVGRNALFNSVIQAALPIAQQDAQAKLSVFQQQVSNEQQAALANSQFFQTLTVKNLDNRQQAAILNATMATNTEIANANNMTQASINNAKNFLAMDMANLSNEQQTLLANAQFRQQTILSNQAAENVARQFNATNQQQADQFNANLANSVSQFNTVQANAAKQFSAAQSQQAQVVNTQVQATLSQFNSQMQFNRDQFNSQNALAIQQSNAQWRRQINQTNTAGINAVNQANAMNAFNLSNQALTFLWQEQRDAAKWANDNNQNEEERKTRMAIAALGNESMKDASTLNNIKALAGAAASIFDAWG